MHGSKMVGQFLFLLVVALLRGELAGEGLLDCLRARRTLSTSAAREWRGGMIYGC